MKKLITISFIAASAVAALAFTTPKKSNETIYKIDTKTTTAVWLGKKVTGQHTGGVNITSGKVITDGKNITSGTIEFDMNSITCTDLADKGYNDKLIGHLKSDEFFGTAKNPTAKFEITKAAVTDPLKPGNDYNITGKLTIKGITNEITFPALIKMDEKTMVVIAKIIVNRTKFGLVYGSASFVENIGDKAISDDFELSVNVTAGAGLK